MKLRFSNLDGLLPRWLAKSWPAAEGMGLSWLLFDRVCRIVLGLAVNMVLARALGPGEFGRLSYALAMGAMVLPLSTLGLERIVVRELAAGRLAEGTALGAAGLLRTAGGLAGWLVAVAWAFAASGPEEAHVSLVALVVAGNVFLGSDVVDWVFQARGNFRPCVAARLLAYVVCAIAKLALARCGAGVVGIAAVVLAEAIFSAALLWLVWRRNPVRDEVRCDAALAKRLVVAAAPLLAAEVAVWIFQRVDVLILEARAGVEAIGIYAAAQRLAQIGFFLPGIVVQVLSPRVARMGSAEEALRFVQGAMMSVSLAAYVLGAALALGAGPLVALLFGADFAPAGPVLIILAWSNVFVFMGCMHSLYLVNVGLQGISLRLTWLTAVVSVVLNLLLIPKHGALGAALANLVTYGGTTVFGVALYRGSRPLLTLNLCSLAAPALVPLGLFRAWRRKP